MNLDSEQPIDRKAREKNNPGVGKGPEKDLESLHLVDTDRVVSYLSYVLTLDSRTMATEFQSFQSVQDDYRASFLEKLSDEISAGTDAARVSKAIVLLSLLQKDLDASGEQLKATEALTARLAQSRSLPQQQLLLQVMDRFFHEEQKSETLEAHLLAALKNVGSAPDQKIAHELLRVIQKSSQLEQGLLPKLWDAMKSGSLPGAVFVSALRQFKTESIHPSTAAACADALGETLLYRFTGDAKTIEGLKRDTLVKLHDMKGDALSVLPQLIDGCRRKLLSADVISYLVDASLEDPSTISQKQLNAMSEVFEKTLLSEEGQAQFESALPKLAELLAYGAVRNDSLRELFFKATLENKVGEQAFTVFMKGAHGLYDEEVVSMLLEIPYDDHGCQAEKSIVKGCAYLGPIGFQELSEHLDAESSVFLLKRVLPAFSAVPEHDNELSYSQAATSCDRIAQLTGHRYLEVRYSAVRALGHLSSDYDDVRRINRARLVKEEDSLSELARKWLWKVRHAADNACIQIRKRCDPFESKADKENPGDKE